MSPVSQTLRNYVSRQAGFRCGYCLTQELVSGVPLTLEHLIPRAKGGGDMEENLWLSCRLCNEAKGIITEAPDPETGRLVLLFNPRKELWRDHFEWSKCGTHVIGITPIGRATVEALALNSNFRVRARSLWVEVGWHPPA